MVLRLKSWESRSLPGFQNFLHFISFHQLDAGWSSPVARQAHNLKVVSSNLAPATKNTDVSINYLNASPSSVGRFCILGLIEARFGSAAANDVQHL